MEDWQSWAALTVVALTIVAFALQKRRGKTGGCDDCGPGGCGPDEK